MSRARNPECLVKAEDLMLDARERMRAQMTREEGEQYSMLKKNSNEEIRFFVDFRGNE